MSKSVAEKMGVRAECALVLIDAPEEGVAALELRPLQLARRLEGEFDYLRPIQLQPGVRGVRLLAIA